jgi:hypothetical protein
MAEMPSGQVAPWLARVIEEVDSQYAELPNWMKQPVNDDREQSCIMEER